MTGGRVRDQRGDDALVFLDGTHQTGYVTPVSSSDTVQSRRCTSTSWDFAFDDTSSGWPIISWKPVGP